MSENRSDPGARPALGHAGLGAALALGSALFALVRAAQIAWVELGTGNDVNLYLRYAKLWGGGRAPYADFHPEYPAGALPVFVVPWLFGGAKDYKPAFAAEMALFDLAALLMVIAFAHRARIQSGLTASWGALGLATAGYLACTTALFPVLYSRFDLVPGALVLAALFVSYVRPLAIGSAFAGALLIGIAGGVKLWPLALVPLWLAMGYRRGALRGAFASAVGVGLGLFVTFAPFMPRAGFSLLNFLKYHAARGIQIESTWSTLALSLGRMGLIEATPVHDFGAFHVAGPVPSMLAKASTVLLLLLALAPQALAARRTLGTDADKAGHAALWATLGTTLGFVIGGKVLSPQFMLWVVPLLALLLALDTSSARTRSFLWVAALAAMVLTTVVYPYWSKALEAREDGQGTALLFVGTRNVLLVLIYAYVTWRAAGSPRRRSA
jgi:hypothetical protein